MTALIVIRPDIQQTTHQGLARVLGTMVGTALATLITKIASPTLFLSEILELIFAYASYCVLWVNYAVFAMSLNAYIVFLLSLAGLTRRRHMASPHVHDRRRRGFVHRPRDLQT